MRFDPKRYKELMEKVSSGQQWREPSIVYESPAYYRRDRSGLSPYMRDLKKKEAAAEDIADAETKMKLKAQLKKEKEIARGAAEDPEGAASAAQKAKKIKEILRKTLTLPKKKLEGKIVAPSYFSSEGEDSPYEREIKQQIKQIEEKGSKSVKDVIALRVLKEELKFAEWAKQHPKIAATLSNVSFLSGAGAKLPKTIEKSKALMKKHRIDALLEGRAPINYKGSLKFAMDREAMARRIVDDLARQKASSTLSEEILKREMINALREAQKTQQAEALSKMLGVGKDTTPAQEDARSLRRNAIKSLLGKKEEK